MADLELKGFENEGVSFAFPFFVGEGTQCAYLLSSKCKGIHGKKCVHETD